MNLNQYTTKSQEAIQKAQQIALDFGHQSIEPQHLLEGILQVDENISAFLMKKSEADLNLIREKNREALVCFKMYSKVIFRSKFPDFCNFLKFLKTKFLNFIYY